MSKENKTTKKRFRMPWGQICLWSAVAVFATFFIDYTLFWIAVAVLAVSFSMAVCQAGDGTDGGLPWYYGGGLF